MCRAVLSVGLVTTPSYCSSCWPCLFEVILPQSLRSYFQMRYRKSCLCLVCRYRKLQFVPSQQRLAISLPPLSSTRDCRCLLGRMLRRSKHNQHYTDDDTAEPPKNPPRSL